MPVQSTGQQGNKKRTNYWLEGTGLQLPVGPNQYDPIKKIAYSTENVNENGSSSINGFYDPKTGTIEIAIDALDGAPLFVAMH